MKTKKILVAILTLTFLVTSVVAPFGTANAATTTYTLTVTINTGVQSVTVIAGSTTKTFTSSGTMTISSGVYVQYTTVAKSDYYISSGGSSSFYMTSDKTIAPIATHNPYTLTVTLNEGVQSITVAYGTTSQTFTSSGTMSVPFATSFTWTATAEKGYVLSATSGSNTMYYPITISPTATLTNYTLTVTLNTGVASVTVTYGSTSKTFTSSGTVSVPAGTGVTWTAVAATGYNLASSSGSLNMSSDQTIVPTAIVKSYILSVTLNEGVESVTVTYGSVAKTFTSNGVLSISYGTNVTWSATAATGYQLASSSGSFNITSDYTLSPTASLKNYTLTVTLKTGVASVTVKYGSTSKTFTSSGTISVPYGTGVTWTAVAATGYNLASSSGSLNMSSDQTLVPTATLKTNILTVTLNEGVQSVTVTYGSSSKTFTSDGVLSISYGTKVTWTATAKAEYTMSTDSGSIASMTSAQTIAPTATHNPYTLTVTLNTGVASVTVKYGSTSKTFTSSGTVSVPYSTGVTWTAVAATGYNLASSSGSFNMLSDQTISPTATLKTNILTVTLNEGVQSVTVTYGSSTKTFTSDGVLSISYGTKVTWTATAKAGYNMSTDSGSIASMTSAQTIAPTATVKTFTVTMSYYPSDANYTTFSWQLEWVSGKSLTGDVSDYVTMTVASDGKSVTLTFVKDFSAGEMVLTCYATADPTIKGTCSVKCGS